jgi:hypothetical protein
MWAGWAAFASYSNAPVYAHADFIPILTKCLTGAEEAAYSKAAIGWRRQQ